MKQLISRLILLVGLSLLFDGCGGGSETSSFTNTTGSTTQNPSGGSNVVDNGQNSNSGTNTNTNTNTVATKKLLFVDATCQGLTLTAIS